MDFLARIFRKQKPTAGTYARVFLTNTLTGHKELFVSQKPGLVLLYSCGPTMYAPVQIGNLRSYVFSDTLARVLMGAGYTVRRVLNITDFGHLVSDGDEGEDKMTKGLKREKMALTLQNMRTLSERYTTGLMEDLKALEVNTATIDFPRASDYIREQIAFIQTLEQKEYAYRTKEGVYFDTGRFPAYGALGSLRLDAQEDQGRARHAEKRHPSDFVLWKPDAKLGWESPWGLGFPGWHIECSTMSRSLLGPEIDIHTGGEDLISVHHNNEIAQSEAASGRTFVHYWLHNAFLTMQGEKASKSLGNVVYLDEIRARGIQPLALRYLFLQAHYRTPLNFTWDALLAAESALIRLWNISRALAKETKRTSAPSETRARFLATMRDDLSTPQALGILWESLKSEEYSPEEKWGLIEDADHHLGLSLVTPPDREDGPVPDEVQKLSTERELAREKHDFATADRLREEIEKRGYRVDDGPEGTMLTRATL